MIDICPVGALTDRDFRFQVRVWYLDSAKSVCNGCARGLQCRDPHEPSAPASQPGQAGGPDQAARQCPGQQVVDLRRGPLRLRLDRRRSPGSPRRPSGKRVAPSRPPGTRRSPTLGAALRRYRPEEIGILASPQMSNEDLFALKRLADQLHLANVDHRVPPADSGRPGRLPDPRRQESEHAGGRAHRPLTGARRARRGGDDRGGGVRGGSSSCGSSTTTCPGPRGLPHRSTAALATAEMVVFQGTNANRTSAAAHLVLPSAAYVEREGTFTNFEGRVQRFRTALDAARRGAAGLGGLLGARAWRSACPTRCSPPRAPSRCSRALAGAVPAYAGMSYRALGDGGLVAGS